MIKKIDCKISAVKRQTVDLAQSTGILRRLMRVNRVEAKYTGRLSQLLRISREAG